jgi:hypothetical protein
MNEIDWKQQQRRFMSIAYEPTMKAARRAFWKWPEHKREDATQTCIAMMWQQWVRVSKAGKKPESMLGTLIKFACLHVKYDRPVSIEKRARSFDLFDYRAKMTRQMLSDEGAEPTDRSDPRNSWIKWDVQAGDDPCDLAGALETTGVSLAQWCDL